MMRGLTYLDIETTGLHPKQDKLLTVQHQPLGRSGDMVLHGIWRHGMDENKVVDAFFDATGFHEPKSKWDFIPVGTNLLFEMKWLWDRALRYGWTSCMETNFQEWVDRPMVDVQPLLIFFNDLEFKGCGLDNYSRKSQTGASVPEYAARGLWDQVERYVIDETAGFVEMFNALREGMPQLWNGFVKPIVTGPPQQTTPTIGGK